MSDENLDSNAIINKRSTFIVNEYKIEDKPSTHTSISGGKWYIDDEWLNNFYNLVGEAMFKDNVD